MKLYIDIAHCGDDSNVVSWYQYPRFAETLGELIGEEVPVVEGGELEYVADETILYHANWSLHPQALDDIPEEVRARFILMQVGRSDMDELLSRYNPFGVIEQHGYDSWSADGDPGDWSGIILPEHLVPEGYSKTGLSEDTPYVIVPPAEGGLPATLIKYIG